MAIRRPVDRDLSRQVHPHEVLVGRACADPFDPDQEGQRRVRGSLPTRRCPPAAPPREPGCWRFPLRHSIGVLLSLQQDPISGSLDVCLLEEGPMPRPYGDPVEIITAPVPRSSRSSPLTRRSWSGRSGQRLPIPSRSCCYRASSTGCSSGGTRTPTRSTGGGSSGESPPAPAVPPRVAGPLRRCAGCRVPFHKPGSMC